MKWKPNVAEKAWIRKEAANAVGLYPGQITLDAVVDGKIVPWADFVRTGVEAENIKSVKFDIYEMTGFGKDRKRSSLCGGVTVHVKAAKRPKVVYIT